MDGISFTVPPGQVFGLLGPNGAGKSTTIEMIEGLRVPDSGRITLLGLDAVRQSHKVKERIGVQLQNTSFFKQLSPRRLLRLFGSFFPRSLPPDQLIAWVNLEEKADAPSVALSGGQRQRLAIAVALVNDPAVVFLDEPTTGLDPQARRSLWDIIFRLRAEGKTVLLTTHYLEEAEQLCDQLVIIDHGRIIARGTPSGLIAEHFERASVEFQDDARLLPAILERLPAVDSCLQRNGQTTLFSANVADTAAALIAHAREIGAEMRGLSIHSATLEDVFLKLTGKHLRE